MLMHGGHAHDDSKDLAAGGLDPHAAAEAAGQTQDPDEIPPNMLATRPAAEAEGGAGVSPQAVGDPLLPDMVPVISQAKGYLHDWAIDTDEPLKPGRTLIRFSTAIGNQGRGQMELRGSTVNGDGTQDVLQRIYQEGGTFADRLAGKFTYHQAHNHIHFNGFAAFRLRAVTAGDVVGDVVAAGEKVSFCLLDIDRFDPTLPNSPAGGFYTSCGATRQGISVGWADVYDRSLADQWIDVTAVPNGRYWLEVVADPDNALQETNENNNTGGIFINLTKPVGDPYVTNHRPAAATPVPTANSVEFDFSESMQAGSFSVAADVLGFTGPGGTNLLSTISGSTWVDADTLRVNFTAATTEGSYALTIGPNILSSDNGRAMDQDGDGTVGEAVQDRYTATFAIDASPGPDAFGYEATAVPAPAGVDLVPNAPGVVEILDVEDDRSVQLPLGTNTFNFYGTTYTGSSKLYVGTNGLITFGAANTGYENGDLSDSPAQPTIAVLWDDLHTDGSNASTNGPGAVLYKFEDTGGSAAPDRLIVEWNEVQRYSSSPSAMTFRAILQLNTGAAAGEILLNYPDVDSGNRYRNADSATVGIKAANNPGGRRLLIWEGQDTGTAANSPITNGRTFRIARRPLTVTGRHLFYNNSHYDNPANGAAFNDDAAIAPGKTGLLPGGTATFANYTGYAKGINGVMIDVVGLPTDRTLTAADLEFFAGNTANPAAWPAAPAPAVEFRRGAGAGGTDRVTLTWPDGQIKRTWLRVALKANANTALTAPDVFYFGSAPGDTFDNAAAFTVSSQDVARTRNAQLRDTALAGLFDHNRDGQVNTQDQVLARSNQGFTLAKIAAPVGVAGAATAPAAGPKTPGRAVRPGSTVRSLSVIQAIGLGLPLNRRPAEDLASRSLERDPMGPHALP